MPLIDLLRRAGTPLTVQEIARILRCDEETATLALRELRHAGLAHWNGIGWTIDSPGRRDDC